MLKNFFSRIPFIARYIQREVRAAMAYKAETESTITSGRRLGQLERDRTPYDRKSLVLECVKAWRENPIARRLVEITTEYILGAEGFKIECEHEPTQKFLMEFWHHFINEMDEQINEWADESTRSGTLFVLFSTDASGMPLVRAVAAENIENIQTKGNDYRQAERYETTEIDVTYPAYDRDNPQPVFMVHFPINRLVGSAWGESDLGPILVWIKRYTAWLEDRARLNRFRNAFIWVVKRKWVSETEKTKKQNELNANPPQPGTVMVADTDEIWEAPAPKLNSADANEDGLAIKKMVGSGFGIPMHWLSEPEGSTRTTAEAAGLPTFKRFEQRQRYFKAIIEQVLKIAVRIRADYDSSVNPKAQITVTAPDVSERDNAALSLAVTNVVAAMKPLADEGIIGYDELLRIAYRFMGETYPPKAKKPTKKEKPDETTPTASAPSGAAIKIDAKTNDVTTPGAA